MNIVQGLIFLGWIPFIFGNMTTKPPDIIFPVEELSTQWTIAPQDSEIKKNQEAKLFPQIKEASNESTSGSADEKLLRHLVDHRTLSQKNDLNVVVNGVNKTYKIFVITANETGEDRNGDKKSFDLSTSTSEKPNHLEENKLSVSEGCIFKNNSQNKLVVSCLNVSIYDVAPLLPAYTYALEIIEGPKSMQYLTKPILSHLPQLDTLIIKMSHVRYVTPKFFTGLSNLRNLRMDGNWIAVLKNTTFDTTPHLENVNLRGNMIMNVKTIAAALGRLKNLTNLDMHENYLIRVIHSDSFLPLTNSSLRQLNLVESQILKIERDAFKPLRNLRVLDIGTNAFTAQDLMNLTYSLEWTDIRSLGLRYIPEVVRAARFPSNELSPLQYTRIEHLDMAYNHFRIIPNYALANFTFLTHLNLRGCGIEQISNNAFGYMPKIQYLDLQENKIYYIGPAITTLPTLRQLILKYYQRNELNTQFSIKENSLANLNQLEVLDLTSVPKEFIQIGDFSGLVNLKDLRLGQCSISSVQDFSFRDLRSLAQLVLSGNQITTLTNNTFFGLRNLKLLALFSNEITIEPTVSPFMHLQSLETLSLGENKLTFLYPKTFYGLHNLGLLHLSSNDIKPWFQPVLPLTLGLQVLVVNSNDISHVTSTMLNEFQNLEVLDIRNNPFQCDKCGMKEFQDWLMITNVTIPYKNRTGDENSFNCVAPSDLEGSSIFNVSIPTEDCFPKEINLALIATISIVIPVLLIFGIVSVTYYLRWYIRYWIFLMRTNVRRYRMSVNDSKYEYDAFVSYCATESTWVIRQLVPTLEGQNYNLKLCLHDRDFEPGRLITDNIIESIERSRKTVLVLSEAYVKSKWCMLEMHMAQHRLFDDTRDALILVELKELEKSSLPKTLKYLIKTRTYISWTTNAIGQKLFWERLKDALRKPSDTFEMKMIV